MACSFQKGIKKATSAGALIASRLKWRLSDRILAFCKESVKVTLKEFILNEAIFFKLRFRMELRLLGADLAGANE
ncbi:MAG: hypothetical protein RSH26_07695, partial [Clostridia bacterium]